LWDIPRIRQFGWVADHLGRRKAFLVYSLVAAVLIPSAAARSQIAACVELVAFSTGFFPDQASWSEIFLPP
jgi:hypothetical protein